MKMASVSKLQFVNLNDKRYYFSDGIVFYPLDIRYYQICVNLKNLIQKFIMSLKMKKTNY